MDDPKVKLPDLAKKHGRIEQHWPTKDMDGKNPTKHCSLTKTGRKLEEERRRKEKRKNEEVEKNTQSKKSRLNTPTSSTSESAYAAFTQIWDKTIKQYTDTISQLEEQLWEQQEKSESLARAYNEETRAARRLISEIEAENAALKEKVGLTRKAVESLKVLMEL